MKPCKDAVKTPQEPRNDSVKTPQRPRPGAWGSERRSPGLSRTFRIGRYTAFVGAVNRNSYHEGMMDLPASLRRQPGNECVSGKTAGAAAPSPNELEMRFQVVSMQRRGIIG